MRIDRIRLLEELKGAGAAQAVETVIRTEVEAAQSASGVKNDAIVRSVGAQVGLARRCGPFQPRRYVGWCTILTSELPNTFAALAAGRVNEWRAMVVRSERRRGCRASSRAAVDRQLAPRLEKLGDRGAEVEARRLAYRLDPEGAAAKVRGAESDRRVTLRPAPETMARLTGLLPVAQGVAAYASLVKEADRLIGLGDPRGRGQLMADLLVERVTGQTAAADVPVEINLIMTVDSLLDPAGPGGAEPAHLDGYGPLPAPVARELALGPGSDSARADDAPRGSAGCSPARAADSWWRWTAGGGPSLTASGGSSRSATSGVARPTAKHRSGTPTTSEPPKWAGPPTCTTAAGNARPATTPNQSPGWHSA